MKSKRPLTTQYQVLIQNLSLVEKKIIKLEDNKKFLKQAIKKMKNKIKVEARIIVAAKRVFSEKGYSKSTMEDIAREAELSPGILYFYFKNKDELYAAVIPSISKNIAMQPEEKRNKCSNTCDHD